MSAFIVEKAHIDILVNAAAQCGLVTTVHEANSLGSMLWEENVRSVNYRYGEDTAPPQYTTTGTEAPFDTIAVLKVLAGYEYQSCEHPEWQDSDAFATCRRIREAADALLPADMTRLVNGLNRMGPVPAYRATSAYHDAPWCPSSMDEMPAPTQDGDPTNAHVTV